jgi:hypothetical protein
MFRKSRECVIHLPTTRRTIAATAGSWSREKRSADGIPAIKPVIRW